MTSPIAGEREAFEAWFEHHFMAGLDGPGEWDQERNCYVTHQVHMAWKGWQARAALLEPVGGGDALDAARWRRLVNASELPFPVATIADDPENECNLIYGRTGLERLIDSCDEISDTYKDQP